MAQVFEELAALDRLIHEPARLAILTALSACSSADFLFLQRLTGLTKGNLSSHLSKLEEASLIEIEKSFFGRTPHTQVRLTEKGRAAIDQHWQKLEESRKNAQRWRPENKNSDRLLMSNEAANS
jgi:DNA-binding MarR family transcriptional regulator